ncbi:protein TBATA-like [Argonauta hians]
MNLFKELYLPNVSSPNRMVYTSSARGSTGQPPESRGGYRFGQYSLNSFFTRHSPHPKRVKHIRGLLDDPVCTVFDSDTPSSYFQRRSSGYRSIKPSPSISSDTERFKRLRHFYKERILPTYGPLDSMENWNKEFHNFTDQLGLEILNNRKTEDQDCDKAKERTRSYSSIYSSKSGRLVPPPSRSKSRRLIQTGQKEILTPNLFRDDIERLRLESTILSLLCQILQTTDMEAIQGWLICASENERNIVSNLIRAAVASQTNVCVDIQHKNSKQLQQINPLPPIKENTAVHDITFSHDNYNNDNKNYREKGPSKIDRLIVEHPSEIDDQQAEKDVNEGCKSHRTADTNISGESRIKREKSTEGMKRSTDAYITTDEILNWKF